LAGRPARNIWARCWCWMRRAISSSTRAAIPREKAILRTGLTLPCSAIIGLRTSISDPYQSRLRGGSPSIALTRRLLRPDGSFARVVLLAVNLEYFPQPVGGLSLGPHGSGAPAPSSDSSPPYGEQFQRNRVDRRDPPSSLVRESPHVPRIIMFAAPSSRSKRRSF
jgi:hypothetical protein